MEVGCEEERREKCQFSGILEVDQGIDLGRWYLIGERWGLWVVEACHAIVLLVNYELVFLWKWTSDLTTNYLTTTQTIWI